MNQRTDDFLDVPAQQAQFRELVGDALRHARQAGATDAAVEISESRGLSVSVRQRAMAREPASAAAPATASARSVNPPPSYRRS